MPETIINAEIIEQLGMIAYELIIAHKKNKMNLGPVTTEERYKLLAKVEEIK